MSDYQARVWLFLVVPMTFQNERQSELKEGLEEAGYREVQVEMEEKPASSWDANLQFVMSADSKEEAPRAAMIVVRRLLVRCLGRVVEVSHSITVAAVQPEGNSSPI